MVYVSDTGQLFKFNDMVEITCTLLPRAETIGRLIQVRKNKGKFGSDQILIRRGDSTLMFFENAGIRHTSEVVPVSEHDSEDAEYSFNGGMYPETGFLVEDAKQPNAPPACFGLAIGRG